MPFWCFVVVHQENTDSPLNYWCWSNVNLVSSLWNAEVARHAVSCLGCLLVWLRACGTSRILKRDVCLDSQSRSPPSTLPGLSSCRHGLKTPAQGHTLLPWQLLFESTISFPWEQLMEGARGAVKIDFHLYPLYLHLWPWQSTAAAVKSPQSQNILCRREGSERWVFLCVSACVVRSYPVIKGFQNLSPLCIHEEIAWGKCACCLFSSIFIWEEWE